jgi:hypothetical protein
MKPSFLSLTLLIAAGIVLATAAGAGEVNTGYFGAVAIKGYDSVAYFSDRKAVRGSEAFSFEWLGATWRFSTDEHRRMFAASPISYAPQYGGLCSEGVAAHGEATVNIDPESWQIIEGKLYLSAAAHFQERGLDVAAAEEKWPISRAKLAQ